MEQVNVHEAKTHLSKLLARVAKGECIVIARNGVPIAELRPIGKRLVARRLGDDRGKVRVADDFNDPLPAELLAEFYK